MQNILDIEKRFYGKKPEHSHREEYTEITYSVWFKKPEVGEEDNDIPQSLITKPKNLALLISVEGYLFGPSDDLIYKINDNKLHHAVLVLWSEISSLFVDGILVASHVVTNLEKAENGLTLIGGLHDLDDQLPGVKRIDEISKIAFRYQGQILRATIFNRVLTKNEVEKLYQKGQVESVEDLKGNGDLVDIKANKITKDSNGLVRPFAMFQLASQNPTANPNAPSGGAGQSTGQNQTASLTGTVEVSAQPSVYPFDIDLTNQIDNTSHAIYIISDKNKSADVQKIDISIINKTADAYQFEKFTLTFRKGTLHTDLIVDDAKIFRDKISECLKGNYPETQTNFSEDDANINFEIISPEGRKFEIAGKSGLTLSLSGVYAAPGTGTRTTGYKIQFEGVSKKGENGTFTFGRNAVIQIINHQGVSYAPVHFGVQGSNFLLNKFSSNSRTITQKDFDTTGEVTYSVWFKITVDQKGKIGNTQQPLICRPNYYFLWYNRGHIEATGATDRATPVSASAFLSQDQKDQVLHAVMTVSKDGILNLYLDGSHKDRSRKAAGPYTGNYNISIGAIDRRSVEEIDKPIPDDRGFFGEIFRATLFDRCLDSNEVTQLFNCNTEKPLGDLGTKGVCRDILKTDLTFENGKTTPIRAFPFILRPQPIVDTAPDQSFTIFMQSLDGKKLKMDKNTKFIFSFYAPDNDNNNAADNGGIPFGNRTEVGNIKCHYPDGFTDDGSQPDVDAHGKRNIIIHPKTDIETSFLAFPFTETQLSGGDGVVKVHVAVENLPGYWDSVFEVPFFKGPLSIKDDLIGINTLPQSGYALSVKGGVSLKDELEVNKKLTAQDELVVNKKLTANDELEVNKKLTAQDDLEVKGTLTVQEELVLNGKLTLKHDIQIQGRIQDKDGDLMPVGSIIAYGGKGLPTGWLLCNGGEIPKDNEYDDLKKALGRNNVPDLRGRFILGENTNHPLDSTGGTEEHVLTEAQMPKHSHGVNKLKDSKTPGYLVGHRSEIGAFGWVAPSAGNAGSYDKIALEKTSNETGGNESHNNMPPYYVLKYIIKF